MSESPKTIPGHVWLWWSLTAAGIGVAFSPYPDASYPLTVVAFFGIFGSFVGGAPKGLVRLPALATGQMTVSGLAVTLGVAAASWANVWLVTLAALMVVSLSARYMFFSSLGYVRFMYVDVAVLTAQIALYFVGCWLPPDGITAWLAMFIYLPFGVLGYQALFIRQRRMLKAFDSAKSVGEKAPDFTLQSHRNESISLSDFVGTRPVLLFFVRGDWCPGCHIMLRSYQKSRAKFKERNVAVLAIGPDPIEVNRNMVDTLGLEFGFLFDDGMHVAKQYGILLEGSQPAVPYKEGMPLPASFLIDDAGFIRFKSRKQELGMMLEPEAILPALAALPQPSH